MPTRRRFLIRAAGLGIVSLGCPLPATWTRAAAVAGAGADPVPTLVVVELRGGNDGLNTVVPYGDDVYHQNRPTLRIDPAEVLKLDDHVGLHPAMEGLRRIWEDGNLAIIQGVGYPHPNRSHFRSMEIWQSGHTEALPTTGWLGTVTDHDPAVESCHIGSGPVPLAVQGRKSTAPTVGDLQDYRLRFGHRLPATGGRYADPVLEEIRQRFDGAQEMADLPAGIETTNDSLEKGSLRARLAMIRTLIESGAPFRIFYTVLGGFDTHVGQRFVHRDLLENLSNSVSNFLTELRERRLGERVVVLVLSEFGRRVRENGNQGTDHGTAAPVFVLGEPVRGGLHGPYPDLANLIDGDPEHAIDFREVYATLLDSWLGCPSERILGGRFEHLPIL